jgi:hypothetical protein
MPTVLFVALVLPGAGWAQTNLVQNGTFAVTGTTQSFQFGTFTQSFLNSSGANTSYVEPGTLTDWASTNAFNFVFQPSSAASGATSMYTGTTGAQPFQVYNSATSPSNSFTLKSPTLGDYIAADGAYDTGAITQTINGLQIGATYTLSFVWAGAQESDVTPAATTEQWQVTLGSQVQSTPVKSNTAAGFTGWFTQTFTYTATATSELLSFLAIGTPTSGQPPVVLLSNVSLTQVPEPASAAVLFSGVAGLISLRRRRTTSA